MDKLKIPLPDESGEYLVKVLYGNGTTDNFYMVCYFNKDSKKFSIEAQTSNDQHNDYFFRELALPVISWFELPKDNLSFKQASTPLIKWLAENVHPHHAAIVTATGAELLEGQKSHQTTEFLVD